MDNEVKPVKIKRMKGNDPDYVLRRYGGRLSITDKSGESEILTTGTEKRIGAEARSKNGAIFIKGLGMSMSDAGLVRKTMTEHSGCRVDARLVTTVYSNGDKSAYFLFVIDGEK